MATFTGRYQLRGSLGGKEHQINLSESTSLSNVIDQVLTVGTTEVTLFSDGSAVAGATLTSFALLYIENQDSTNYLEIGLKNTGATNTAYFRVPAGKHFALYNQSFEADGGAIATAETLITVTARFNTASGLCRIVVGAA